MRLLSYNLLMFLATTIEPKEVIQTTKNTVEKLHELTPSELFAPYYKPPIGSIRYSLQLMSKLIGPDLLVDEPQLRQRIDTTVALIENAARLQFQWISHQRKDAMRREGVMEADNDADRALGALSDMFKGFLRLPAGNPRHQAAERLSQLIMPRSVGVITSQRFELQYSSTDLALEILDNDGLAHVQLLNLEPFVDDIREANRTYGDHLSSLDNTGVTHPEVKAATRTALDSFFGVIITVWSHYLDAPDTRKKLLAPIYEQNERIRAFYKNKKKTPRIDPKSGEVLEGDEDSAENAAELVLDMTPNTPIEAPVQDPA